MAACLQEEQGSFSRVVVFRSLHQLKYSAEVHSISWRVPSFSGSSSVELSLPIRPLVGVDICIDCPSTRCKKQQPQPPPPPPTTTTTKNHQPPTTNNHHQQQATTSNNKQQPQPQPQPHPLPHPQPDPQPTHSVCLRCFFFV